jgi:hypothetical protein
LLRIRRSSTLRPPMSTVATAIPNAPRTAVRWRRDRIFFTALPILMTAVVFAGFAPTYYLRPLFEAESLPWLYQVHGLLFTAWMLLLIVQPVLVAARRTDIHRRIGPVGGALALLMVVAALAVTIDLGRRAPAPPPGAPPLMVFLSVPFATLVVFPVLVGAALYWRRNADAHKRLMLVDCHTGIVACGSRPMACVGPAGAARIFWWNGPVSCRDHWIRLVDEAPNSCSHDLGRRLSALIANRPDCHRRH